MNIKIKLFEMRLRLYPPMLSCSSIFLYSLLVISIYFSYNHLRGPVGLLESQVRLSVTCDGGFLAIRLIINERLI